MIIRDRKHLTGVEDPIKLLQSCIAEHQADVSRMKRLLRYYKGDHDIMYRAAKADYQPNNRLVNNHAQYITDMLTSYMAGVPITYAGAGAELINETFKAIDIHSHDTELTRDISIFGRGYELHFMTSDEVPLLQVKNISPLESFVVVDNSVENKPIMGVRYYNDYDIDNTPNGKTVEVYTEWEKIVYSVSEVFGSATEFKVVNRKPHYMGRVPLIEYRNNKVEQGDFEQVISLIDAYNLLQSDRVNDKQQLVDSILAIFGASLGDTEAEVAETSEIIKKYRLLELPEKGRAEYLHKTLNETETEILKEAIKNDIHEFAMVPCLTDKNFAIQASGVAMKFKLLGLEQKAKTKESYLKQGIRQRLKIFETFLKAKGVTVNVDMLTIVFNRALPSNELELANVVSMLNGMVSSETLLSLLPFVNDVKTEHDAVKKEQADKMQQEQAMINSFGFDDPKEKNDKRLDDEQ